MNDHVVVAGRTDAGALILHVPTDLEDSVLELIDEEAYA